MEAGKPHPVRDRLVRGGSFILNETELPPAVWGRGSEVLWSSGEGLLICGPQGVGKSTLAQQLALRRVGVIGDGELLGFPLAVSDRPLLYLAMDRPRQVARSMRRMVTPAQRGQLQKRLRFWEGPLPFSLAREPFALADLAESVKAGGVVIDSYKDLMPTLSNEESGAAINTAMQEVLARGMDWIGLHHQRKASSENSKPNKLDDVYGSAWLTAGVGSVLLLWGRPGSQHVEMLHLKQPAERVGTLKLRHDTAVGAVISLKAEVDLLAALAKGGRGGLAEDDLAKAVFGAAGRQERRVLKRQLQHLGSAGSVECVSSGAKGGSGGGGRAAVWRVATA